MQKPIPINRVLLALHARLNELHEVLELIKTQTELAVQLAIETRVSIAQAIQEDVETGVERNDN